MSVKTKDLIKAIEMIAPKELMEEWDNTGFQLDLQHDMVSKILICLDVNETTIAEAKESKCDFIISHHPLFFQNIHMISAGEAEGRYVIDLIQAGISVYASHTSFDKTQGGNNDYLAELFELREITTPEEAPILRIGFLYQPIPLKDAYAYIKKKVTDASRFRVIGDLRKSIHKVAICSGAGSAYLKTAKELDCDLLITGDVKYHDARTAEELNIGLIDAGHFETEILFRENMAEKLKGILEKKVEIVLSQNEKSPFKN